jgi:excisionase family DNA binding protein
MGFLTVRQVAQRLQVSVAMVYKLCTCGKLAHVRVGVGRGTIRVREQDLAAFIEGCTVERPPTNAAGLKHIKARSHPSP